MKTKSKVKKLKTGFISRNITLGRLSAKTALALVGKKNPDDIIASLAKQAKGWVKELGHLKGGLMKIGQMITMLDDKIIPAQIKDIFAPLGSQSIELDSKVIEGILAKRLGHERLKKLDWEREPYASASIGQVHRARIKKTNENIVLKIQYPRVAKTLDTDIKTFAHLFKILNVWPGFDKAQAEEHLAEVKSILAMEMNYKNEAKNLQTFSTFFEDYDNILVPKHYEEFSTRTILAMEYLPGKPFNREMTKELSKADRHQLAITVVYSLLAELFDLQLVQTDSHAANFRLTQTPDGPKLIMLDFGALKKVSKNRLHTLKKLGAVWFHGRDQGLHDALLDIGLLEPHDSQEIVELYTRITRVSFAALCPDKHPFQNPSSPRLGSKAWGDFLAKWQKDYLKIIGLVSRPLPQDLLFLGRRLLGVRDFLEQLDPDWNHPDFESLLSRYLS